MQNREPNRFLSFFLTLILVLCGGFTLNRLHALSVPGADASVDALSQLGSRGQEVRSIQQKLRSLGFYAGSVDGIYGAQTRRAVVAFQKSVGITADGVAGPKTLLYLGLGSGSASAAKRTFRCTNTARRIRF